MAAHIRLKRADGRVYLNRWGFESDRIGGVFLHKMEAPDPGRWLHDHPWHFWRIVLKGGYVEERYPVLGAVQAAIVRSTYDGPVKDTYTPPRWRVTSIGLGTCHRIISLVGKTSWSLVIHGPKRTDRKPGKLWGFYTPDGWVPGADYDEERGLWNEV